VWVAKTNAWRVGVPPVSQTISGSVDGLERDSNIQKNRWVPFA
jgi:hypothetical protein